MMTYLARRLGNTVYRFAFPIYRPLYGTFKAYADRAERRLLAANLSEGSVVVDAGANIGIYSRFLAKCVGNSGIVHSFEPSPDNFAHLRNAVRNLPNVRTNQEAVGDMTGEQLLYTSRALNVDHRTYAVEDESRDTITIRSIRLDDYFKPGERVDLIKLDIQGYELRALRGASRVLKDNPRIKVLFEFWPYGLRAAGVSPESLLEFLEKNGFTVMTFDGELKRHEQPENYTADKTAFVNLFARK
jgi:FkbM family methyltransferase